ncbi:MAG: CooT family nickel-binding protein [Euryarchaeota archaeon]|nr:CooT family nickel-binding protein [Euryarchaeota archaeon]
MCESTVLLKSAEGISTVMPEAVTVRDEGGVIRCVDIIGREVIIDGARISEIDMLRHRVLLSRL